MQPAAPQQAPAPQPKQSSAIDPQALALARAIELQEGGGKPAYNATGASGEQGAGQWMPGEFKADATAAGLNPNDFSPQNQDQIVYATVKAEKDAGMMPAEIASKWNSGSPDNYTNHSGINSKGIAYNTPAYVQGVQKYYNQLVASSGQQNDAVQDAGNVQLNPPDLPSPQNPNQPSIPTGQSLPNVNGFAPPAPPTQSATPQAQPPQSVGQDILGAVKGIGNFLFPIVGDVANDIQGKSNKTLLQQGGDLALSALPFIPGLGEVGDAARGGELATEGAADVAPGLLGKLTGSTIAKGAAVGYGAGVASNLSQGQGVGQALTPNLNNVGGALLGGAAPIVLKGLGSAAEKLSGISPQIKNALQSGSITEDEYNQYINAAKSRSQNIRAPAPLELAANQLDKASNVIDQNLSQAGKAVGAAKATLGNVKLPSVEPVAGAFAQRVAKDYGLQLTQDTDGIVHATPMPNRTPSIAPQEISRIEAVAQNLVGLQGSTAQNATDVISKLDNSIGYAKAANGLHPFDPIESLLLSVRSGLDDSVRSVAPDLASANDRASALYNLKREVTGMAGGTNQRGELMMKRIFSGDKSGDVQDLFGKIKNETGIDLVNHAVLAKHAIETVGDATQKSILDQMIEGGIEAHTGGIGSGLLNLGKGAARKTFANPETLGREYVTGKAGLLKNAIGKGATKAAVQASRGLPGAIR
jgi:hypothetical protein